VETKVAEVHDQILLTIFIREIFIQCKNSLLYQWNEVAEEQNIIISCHHPHPFISQLLPLGCVWSSF